MTLGHEEQLRFLREQGALLAATPESALGQAVPAVPEWTAEHVLRHTAKVHRWVVAVLRAGPGADLGELGKSLAPAPKGAESISHYRASLDDLLAEFDARDAEEPIRAFAGLASVGWWIRRQAHEVTVHRHDAESAHLAEPAAAAPLLASDGVDEWVANFAPRATVKRGEPPPASLRGKRLALVATDVPGARWAVLGGDTLAQADPDEPADASLALPAWELLLTMWRRRPLDMTAVTGESSIARDIYDYIRI